MEPGSSSLGGWKRCLQWYSIIRNGIKFFFTVGYYAQNVPPVEFHPDNPFCRFKAVGYIKLPSYTPEDGFVEITMNAKETDVK